MIDVSITVKMKPRYTPQDTIGAFKANGLFVYLSEHSSRSTINETNRGCDTNRLLGNNEGAKCDLVNEFVA
jgi:hypothetical protein